MCVCVGDNDYVKAQEQEGGKRTNNDAIKKQSHQQKHEVCRCAINNSRTWQAVACNNRLLLEGAMHLNDARQREEAKKRKEGGTSIKIPFDR